MGNLINLNDKVTTFLKSKNEVVDSLSDYSLLTYLAFLTNVTKKLNTVEFIQYRILWQLSITDPSQEVYLILKGI
jgi:hypothetical protein